MRKIDVLCKEKFNGSMGYTIYHIIKDLPPNEVNEYLKEMNDKEKIHAQNMMYRVAKEKYGEKGVREKMKAASSLGMLSLTKEEVTAAKKNPYKAKLGKGLLKLLIINGGIIALTTIMNNFDLGAAQSTIETLAISGTTIYSSLTAMDIGADLLKYVKFKNLKNYYNKEQQLEEKNQEGKQL